jgi:predicted nucleic-acid-binding protein
MNSYGLDTSVVLRLMLGVPTDQAERAMDFIEECEQGQVTVYVSDLVVLETFHALRHHYNVPVKEAAETLFDFLSSPPIQTRSHSLSVLKEYAGKGAGLADRLIRKEYLDYVSTVVTFDKKFGRLEDMKQL